jgi:class 3 adenylate cyclase/streptogramin lyase
MRGRQAGATLVTVLFTDIVSSTELAKELGDKRWRELLDHHHAIVRLQLKRFHGREIDTAGDGFFAAFTRPADAIRCASACIRGVREVGVEIRAGIHTGEAEVSGSKLSGMSVHIGARTLGAGRPGEILVTRTVRDVVPGSGIDFVDRGLHQLKGVPGEWHLLSVSTIDGKPIESPLDAEEAERRRSLIQPRPLARRRSWQVAVGVLALIALITTLVLLLPTSSSPRSAPSPAADRLMAIDADNGSIILNAGLPGDPSALATGLGSTWVVLPGEQVLSRIDGTTRRVAARIELRGRPTAVAVGAGAVWVVGDDGVLVKVDPSTETVESTIPIGGSLRDVVVADGQVWVADENGTIFRITPDPPRVDRTIETLALFGPEPQEGLDHLGVSLTADEQGLWMVVSVHFGTVHPADVFRIAFRDLVPLQVALSPHIEAVADIDAGSGAVWVASSRSHAIYRMDPSGLDLRNLRDFGNAPTSAPGVNSIRVQGSPRDIVVDAHGTIWAVDGSVGILWKIDRLSNSIDRTIEIPRGVAHIAASESGIWVAIDSP